MRGKGHGVTPSSLYKHPRRRNPTNQEVMQTLVELKAQVRELQKDKERYMAEKCSSAAKETSDKYSINRQNKFPEVIIYVIMKLNFDITIIYVVLMSFKATLMHKAMLEI